MADEAHVSSGELREATLDGVRWISITRIAFEVVAAAGAVALAHLVPPADYGRFAIALVLPEIALSLVNEGLGTPLVQRQLVSKRHIEATMALGIGGGLLMTLLTLVLAPLVAAPIFGGATAELFEIYSPVFVIAGLMIVPLAMLQRRLEFNRIGISEVASAAVTTVVSVALALFGFDAEAYVLGSLAGIAAWAVVLLVFAGMKTLPRPRRREMREMISTGAPAAGAGLAGIGTRNADYAILGAQLTSAQVGFYYRAFTIGVEYERKLSGIVTRIAFPVYSRTKDLDHLRKIRRRIVRLNATTVFPLLAFFIVVAPVLVPWLFGARWEPAVVLAQILAVAGMATTMKNTIDPLILATGRPRPLMYFNIVEVALYVGVLILASSGGNLIVVCAAVSAFRIAALFASYWLLLGRVLDISFGELLGDAGAPAVACLALAAVALPIRLQLDADAVPLLMACAAVGFPAYALVLRLLSPTAWGDLMMVARRMLPSRGRGAGPAGPSGGEIPAAAVPATAAVD
jgi:O-antigen/teichoic acid export membrane protein